jgi:hypothetical protein
MLWLPLLALMLLVPLIAGAIVWREIHRPESVGIEMKPDEAPVR